MSKLLLVFACILGPDTKEYTRYISGFIEYDDIMNHDKNDAVINIAYDSFIIDEKNLTV